MDTSSHGTPGTAAELLYAKYHQFCAKDVTVSLAGQQRHSTISQCIPVCPRSHNHLEGPHCIFIVSITHFNVFHLVKLCRKVGMSDSESGLLQLPHPCMDAVLRCCADDARSLFIVAQAHSKLRQAVAMTLRDISAVLKQYQHVISLQRYCTNHGQHIDSIDLQLGFDEQLVYQHEPVTLNQLPHSKLQGLTSLKFSMLHLHLQPGAQGLLVFQGVIEAGIPLQQLHLDRCTLLDGEEGLAAALLLLPKLQHLSFTRNYSSTGADLRFPSSVLQALSQLTYLEIEHNPLQDPADLQQLQGLTRLQDLRLILGALNIQASVLSGLQSLTRLQLHGDCQYGELQPGALEGMTQLQHLEVVSYRIDGGSAGVAELLSHLQDMQQLTYLSLRSSLHEAAIAEAASYSGLTTSSKLQHLDISSCTLPTAVWRQLFPASCQWPHLRELCLNGLRHPTGPAAAPAGSCLVSCCPGLQSLQMWGLELSTAVLAPLTGLTGLSSLRLRPVAVEWPAVADTSSHGLDGICQLTGLRQLVVWNPSRTPNELLLQLALGLRQLTHLEYGCRHNHTRVFLR
jgi:hypothetical protein